MTIAFASTEPRLAQAVASVRRRLAEAWPATGAAPVPAGLAEELRRALREFDTLERHREASLEAIDAELAQLRRPALRQAAALLAWHRDDGAAPVMAVATAARHLAMVHGRHLPLTDVLLLAQRLASHAFLDEPDEPGGAAQADATFTVLALAAVALTLRGSDA